MNITTPTIEKNETSVIFRFPKSSELDLKVYNPAFFESLGVIATISIVNDVGQEVSSSKTMTGGGNSTTGDLTFPYNQFVYLITRGKDENTSSETETDTTKQEPLQTRFFSAVSNAFSNAKTNIQSGFANMPKLQQKPTPISPIEELETVKTTSPPPLPTLADPETPTVESPITLYETISKVAETVAPKPPIISDKPSLATMVVSEHPSSETLPSDSTQSIVEPSSETPKYYWKVVVESEKNPERNLEKEFWGELQEEWFRDIMRLSELEKKWGVYINGPFYTVYGRKIKIGNVIPYNEKQEDTISSFLKNAVVLDNSLPAKYIR